MNCNIPVMLLLARSDSFIEGSLQIFNAASAAFFFRLFDLLGLFVAPSSTEAPSLRSNHIRGNGTLYEQGGLLFNSVEHRIALVD